MVLPGHNIRQTDNENWCKSKAGALLWGISKDSKPLERWELQFFERWGNRCFVNWKGKSLPSNGSIQSSPWLLIRWEQPEVRTWPLRLIQPDSLALREVSETPNTCWQNLERLWEENREVRLGSARRHLGSESRVKEWAPAPAWAGIYGKSPYLPLNFSMKLTLF